MLYSRTKNKGLFKCILTKIDIIKFIFNNFATNATSRRSYFKNIN